MNVRALFERHYPGLVRFLHRRVGDRDQAEDLAQMAFVRLMERQPASPDGWLYVVAANLARDAARGDRRRTHNLAIFSREHRGQTSPSVEHDSETAESNARVAVALRSLSERDRMLLELWSEGVRYRELASSIGVAPSSIAPLLSRAQQRLHRALERPAVATASLSDAHASS
jgi:RNA polymerase sigma-70 factor (ECF subfamily)